MAHALQPRVTHQWRRPTPARFPPPLLFAPPPPPAAVGLFLSVVGAVPLLSAARAAGDPARLLGVSLYVGGLIAFYASATLNHSLFLTDASRVFRLIDHAAVFALISGAWCVFAAPTCAPWIGVCASL